MNKVISISINSNIYKLSKVGHANYSKYVEELIKADVYKSNFEDMYSVILKRLLTDGHIQPHSEPTCDDVTYTDESQYIPEY